MATDVLGAIFVITVVGGFIYGHYKTGLIGAFLCALAGFVFSMMASMVAGLILPSSWLY